MWKIHANELKSKLTLSMVVEMVEYLGGEFNTQMETEEKMVMNTSLCHDGESWKCDLFKDTLYFHCYSNCGSFSLLDLVQNVMQFETLQESIDFIAEYFNLYRVQRGFGRREKPKPREIPKKKEVDYNEVLTEYDNGILNTFLDYHAVEWLYEGISNETMNKYEIKFDLDSEGIIIPHRDKDGRLIGIRQRNLNKRQLELKRKYVPYTSSRNRVTYKHSLGKNLYGLNINKEKITENKMCVIWESEKSVLKMDSIYGNNPSVCVGGSSISEYQLNLLKVLGCECVYIAFDNELDDDKWEKKMIKIYEKIINFGFKCFMVKDWEQKYLDEKDSPIDKGKEVWKILINQSREYLVDKE